MDKTGFAPPPPRKTRRRWHVPPALTHGPGALEGVEVLEEVPRALGVLLWQSLRDVTLWAEMAEEQRAGLFAPEAASARARMLADPEIERELTEPLRMIQRMMEDPSGTRPEPIALACRTISRWATTHGATATALAFAQGAALSSPHDAGAALKVGQLAHEGGEHARAETWYRRTVGLARQSGDWSSYSRAFYGLGVLYVRRGSAAAARRFFVRCLRVTRRHSLWEIHGRARHELFLLAMRAGQPTRAEEHAKAAFEAYGSEHPETMRLATEIASFWMGLGEFERARAVLEVLLPGAGSITERVEALSGLARAAAGLGERSRFEQAWDEAWPVADRDAQTTPVRTGALLDLARAALYLGDAERAGDAAARAVSAARARGEVWERKVAEELAETAASNGTLEPPRADRETAAHADELAEELQRTLGRGTRAS